ncbi:metalloregulator ArsR/SmtB family transcription factor [Patescibacteria group bacterium]|nr:metalloregulator ArsR/SmtB family transcription factor [Patescibacteria group bacterium]
MKFKQRCCRCFAALSTKNRVEIVKLLQVNKKMAVLEIAKYFNLTQPTVTHHLKYLEKSGILKSKKEGRRVYYRISPPCGKNECEIF